MKKVITYGTFDLFHQGHYNILKRAKEQGDYLVVGVTSESYDIERGKLSVRDSLAVRMENVRKTGFVDEIIIEEYLGQKIHDIKKHEIDTLVIGSDWYGKFDHLRNICEVVYLERTKDISSTQIREENSKIYKIGIATDTLDDKDVVVESKYVSGIHFESVYASDEKTALDFQKKFELEFSSTDYKKFLEHVDFVYINCELNKRYKLIVEAIEKGKHVICDSPFTLDEKRHKEIFEKARKNKVIVVENVVTLYLRAFTQLLWMAQGDVVGDNVNVKCSVSKNDFSKDIEFADLLTLCATVITKINGKDILEIKTEIIRGDDDKIVYGLLTCKYEKSIATIEIGCEVEVPSSLMVIGKSANIIAVDNWWETGYFELKEYTEGKPKRFSFNFEGTGFRYVLQEIMLMLRDDIYENTKLFEEESLSIIKIQKSIV